MRAHATLFNHLKNTNYKANIFKFPEAESQRIP